ncbi:MAG: hypothetical protein Q6367_010165, partial [Candidatus Freyarchaeota archaeon]
FNLFGFWPNMPPNQWLAIWLIYNLSPTIATYLALSIFLTTPPVIPMLTIILISGIVGGIVAALIEGCSGRELDNIYVPLAVTAVILLLVFLMLPSYFAVLSYNLGGLIPF